MSSESEESVFWNDKTYGYEGTFPSEFEHSYRNTRWFEAANQSAINQYESGTKRTRFSPESHHQEGGADSSEQSSPLGLTLRKTPSFLNLVQTSLSQGKKPPPAAAERPKKDDMGSSSSSSSSTTPEKLKASNFPAIFIKIGVWQRTTRNEGDLTAKLYYAKRKLVWEVLDGALKSKIEVQWSDIIAIRATTFENEPGTLEIELNQPPSFYREINPQPRKHTLWQQASDFTGGQAPIWRRHYVRFPPGILDRHYEKLLQCDQRLFALSQKPFPSHESPYFDPTMFGISELSIGFSGYGSPYLHRPYPTAAAPMAPNPAFPGVYPTDFPFRLARSSNQFSAPPHSPWGQGTSFNITPPGNDVFSYQSYQQQQPNVGLINDIESHLMGEPQVGSSEEGTFGGRGVESSTVDVTYDANISGTNYQGNSGPGPDELVHYGRYNMDSGMLDGEYREMSFNWMPAGQPDDDTADEQMGNNDSLPPFVFPDPDDDDPSDEHIF